MHLGASVTLSKLMHSFHQLIDTLPAYKVGGECTMCTCRANGLWWTALSSVCKMCVGSLFSPALISVIIPPGPSGTHSSPLCYRRPLACGRWWSSCAGLRALPSGMQRPLEAISAQPAPSQVPACACACRLWNQACRAAEQQQQ